MGQCTSCKSDPEIINPDNDVCAICLGDIPIKMQSKEFKKQYMKTQCGHLFCKDCLINAKQYSNLCPLCRGRIATKSILKRRTPFTEEGIIHPIPSTIVSESIGSEAIIVESRGSEAIVNANMRIRIIELIQEALNLSNEDVANITELSFTTNTDENNYIFIGNNKIYTNSIIDVMFILNELDDAINLVHI
jgi:hypothetical protein